MLNQEQIKAIRFFRDYGGHATPPGRMVCAKNMMQAEQHAEANSWDFDWGYDSDLDTFWMNERQLKDLDTGNLEAVFCVLTDSHGDVLASLHGIVMGLSVEDQKYRRVVEAELASEGLNIQRCHACGRVR